MKLFRISSPERLTKSKKLPKVMPYHLNTNNFACNLSVVFEKLLKCSLLIQYLFT